ncbi:MAG: hypothetical protein LAT64_04470 [Phycisphaerales bacterium]|nr:hypothetical protein [Planctomycetota bacterium]MCH8508008.1 hypothetical protein [Phycisphaerales bacterium]
MRAIPLCVIVLSLLTWPAQAEWRKFSFAVQHSTSTQQLNTQGPIPPAAFASASGFYTFDTSAPAILRTENRVEFAVQDHEVAVTSIIGAVPRQRILRPNNSTAKIVYDGTSDSLTFILNQTEGPELELRLQIVEPNGPFTVSMQTLPASGYATNGSVFSVLETVGRSFQAIWLSPNNVFVVGAVQYAVGGTLPPEPRPCSAADLAPPFGILNFFDLQEFLQIFSQGCP